MIVLGMSFVSSTVSQAQTPNCSPVIAKCNAALDACDKAISDKNKSLELADIALTHCRVHSSETEYQLDEAKNKLGAWYHDPFVVGVLGLIGGAIVSQTLLK